MQNRYENSQEKLEEIFKDILMCQEAYMKKVPERESEKYWVGYVEAIKHIVDNDVKQYSSQTKDFLDDLIYKKGNEVTEKILKDKGIKRIERREMERYFNGAVSAYNNLYRLCYGFEEDVLSALEEDKIDLARRGWI